ncbi:MAG: ribose-phosphate pyrophosphokinase, partial [Candidatus Levybacteria bacterium]|nr:ribose-phosphate pyrophosphokinase [Candidatus Levybacteria bacterium]
SSRASLIAGARRGSPALTTPRSPFDTRDTSDTRDTFDDLVLVSPDKGGIRRILLLASLLGNKVPCISIEKNRDLNTGEVKSTRVDGEVKRRAIIVDDVISTGKTLISAAELLKKNGAEEIYVMATHGIFAGEAPEDLENSVIKKVIIADTIEVKKSRSFNKLHALSIADLIVDELRK